MGACQDGWAIFQTSYHHRSGGPPSQPSLLAHALCYLYVSFARALTVHFIHASPTSPRLPASPPLGFREAAFPWTSLHRLIRNASLLPSPIPHPPLHYVAFASYCLCIASARLVLLLLLLLQPPPFFFPLRPLHLCSGVGSVPIASSLAARDGGQDTAR